MTERERNAFASRHAGLVIFYARQLRSYAPIDELIAEGNLGLATAMSKFDPSRNVKFATYASYWIRAFMLQHVIRNWSIVRFGTRKPEQQLFWRVRAARMEAREGVVDTAKLARQLRVKRVELEEMLVRMQSGASLDAHWEENASPNKAGWRDRLVDEDSNPEEKYEDAEERARQSIALHSAMMSVLDARERMIVFARASDETLQSIASRVGVTRERVRQIAERAMDKLRKACAA